jgi:hypothetical protein
MQDWRKHAIYRNPGDWVFASQYMDGKQPYWPETPLKCFVQPAAKRAGITKTLGLAHLQKNVRNASKGCWRGR